MIENHNQYYTTKNKLVEFEKALIKTEESKVIDTKRRIAIKSLKSFIAEFKEDIFKYEQRHPDLIR